MEYPSPYGKGVPSFEPGTHPSQRYADRPFIAIWEVTRACDLACVHCRAEAQDKRYPGELDTDQAKELIRQVAEWKVPLFVLTGGDPLKRPDLVELVAECSRRGIHTALAPSLTPLLTAAKLAELKEAGLQRVSLSLDGATSAIFDAFRGEPGTFVRFLETATLVRKLGIPLQINTTLAKVNKHQIWEMARILKSFSIDLWSVFFLVPTGRAQKGMALDAAQTEQALNDLYNILELGWFDIKTTEAHHFRRVVLQRHGVTPEQLERGEVENPSASLLRASRGVSDGRGFVFISHIGDVCPSGFLPLSAGNVKDSPLASIYRDSWLFRRLRETDTLQGKCGRCEYRHLCGGSRARAYALTGEVMGSDPYCVYQPA
jgi:AdoMet-dependent heme synthase